MISDFPDLGEFVKVCSSPLCPFLPDEFLLITLLILLGDLKLFSEFTGVGSDSIVTELSEWAEETTDETDAMTLFKVNGDGLVVHDDLNELLLVLCNNMLDGTAKLPSQSVKLSLDRFELLIGDSD